MNRERQTLELLTLLGDDVANAVLERLQPDRAQTLRSRMSDELLQKSTISRQREVLDEFECFFQFAMKSKLSEDAAREQAQAEGAAAAEAAQAETASATEPAANDPAASDPSASSEPAALTKSQQEEQKKADDAAGSSQESTVSGETETPTTGDGEPTAESQSSEGDQTKDDAMATASSDATKSAGSEQTDVDDPLIALQGLSIHQIAAALASEQSRTTAILLSNLPAKFTGEILNLMKPDYQKLVMKELTKEQHAPPVLIERIARATFARASQLPAEPRTVVIMRTKWLRCCEVCRRPVVATCWRRLKNRIRNWRSLC